MSKTQNLTKFRFLMSRNWKIILSGILIFLIIPIVFINGGLIFCNWLSRVTNININASGLVNQDWLVFWGTYLGGIATVVAVWLTINKSENHYQQTSKEQERQNREMVSEREKQRKLDVLPLLILQPILTKQTSFFALLLGNLEEEEEPKRIYVDEIKPTYEEVDFSEFSLIFGEEIAFRVGRLTKEEMKFVKNKGNEKVTVNNISTDHKIKDTQLYPQIILNGGKESAINVQVFLKTKDGKEISHLNHVFSLLPKDKIKLYILVNIDFSKRADICTDYYLQFSYANIYANNYSQKYPINIMDSEYGTYLSLVLDVDQESV